MYTLVIKTLAKDDLNRPTACGGSVLQRLFCTESHTVSKILPKISNVAAETIKHDLRVLAQQKSEKNSGFWPTKD